MGGVCQQLQSLSILIPPDPFAWSVGAITEQRSVTMLRTLTIVAGTLAAILK
jgi:hypothetical protein